MIECEVAQGGSVIAHIVQADGLEFRDAYGMERANSINSSMIDAAMREWHYDIFGVIRQHFCGRANDVRFGVSHDVRPAVMLSLATGGSGVKNVQSGKFRKEIKYNAGDANISFMGGRGKMDIALNRNQALDMLNIVIPVSHIEQIVAENERVYGRLLAFENDPICANLRLGGSRRANVTMLDSARNILRCRMFGNASYEYLKSEVMDCLSGFLSLDEGIDAGCVSMSNAVRSKMFDARDMIVAHFQDMPSLHDLATMVGTNECTLKMQFKRVFGTTVFGYLYDYRMYLAGRYLLDTEKPVSDIGLILGYDYHSHFCTAFKRKYGVSPKEYRRERGAYHPI